MIVTTTIIVIIMIYIYICIYSLYIYMYILSFINVYLCISCKFEPYTSELLGLASSHSNSFESKQFIGSAPFVPLPSWAQLLFLWPPPYGDEAAMDDRESHLRSRVIKHGWLESLTRVHDFPIQTSIYKGFSVATFDYRRVDDSMTICGLLS